MAALSATTLHRLGMAVAVGAALLQLWMNLAVGIAGEPDNAQNQGFYGVIATAAACAFVARLEAAGMARAMLATAAVQALLALAVASAPVTAQDSNGAAGVLALTGLFCGLWLLAAGLFRRSGVAGGRG